MNTLLQRVTLFVVLFSGCATILAYAQRIVEVAPGINTLNQAIEQDEDPDNAVFVLARGEVYEFDQSIEYDGETLRIRAAEGDGPRPIIRPVVDITGASPAHHIAARSNLYLDDLILLGIDDLGADATRQLRMQKDSTRLSINNCLFETIAQDFVRLDAPGISVYIRNTIGRNNGISDGQRGGRLLDTRGNDVDTLLIQNSTFYQMIRFVLRADGGFIKHLIWDHVTIVNAGLVMQLGRTLEARITNSIFYNLYPPPENLSNIEKPFVTIDSLVSIHGYTDDDRDIVFRNINFVTDTEVRSVIPDTIVQYTFLEPTFEPFIAAGLVDTTNIFSEELDFANAPPGLAEYMMYVWTGGMTDFPRWRAYEDEAAYDDPLVVGELPENTFNFSFGEGARSYSGDDGFPLGDLNWFPELYDEWVSTDVEEISADLPSRFQLLGNYPNPFNPTTRITFDLAENATVRVDVYDVLGRFIAALPGVRVEAGLRRHVTVDGSAWTTGTYFYRVTMESATKVETRSGVMVLVK